MSGRGAASFAGTAPFAVTASALVFLTFGNDGMRQELSLCGKLVWKSVFVTHPFPVELALNCVRRSCPPGGNILDPFAGSGTTRVVAKMLDTRCTLIELNEDYVRLAKGSHIMPGTGVCRGRPGCGRSVWHGLPFGAALLIRQDDMLTWCGI
jgi:hypothetical protein